MFVKNLLREGITARDKRRRRTELRRDNDAAGVWAPESSGKGGFVSRAGDHMIALLSQNQVKDFNSRNMRASYSDFILIW